VKTGDFPDVRDAAILLGIGQGLATLFPDSVPTVVLGVKGTESRGSLLGTLVARHLGIRFAEVRRKAERASDNDVWLRRRTPPDYRDRHLDLAVRRSVQRKVSGAAQGADEESAITD